MNQALYAHMNNKRKMKKKKANSDSLLAINPWHSLVCASINPISTLIFTENKPLCVSVSKFSLLFPSLVVLSLTLMASFELQSSLSVLGELVQVSSICTKSISVGSTNHGLNISGKNCQLNVDNFLSLLFRETM
jgi:hypothetical protein